MNVRYLTETIGMKTSVICNFIPVINFKLIAILCVLPFSVLEAKGAPDSFADLAARLLPSVVNISTMQTLEGPAQPQQNMPKFPPGSPFEEFFKDFMDRNGQNDPSRKRPRRRAQSAARMGMCARQGCTSPQWLGTCLHGTVCHPHSWL